MPYHFGDVILVPFPFTDQTTTKKRPAVVVSSEVYHRERPDLILMAIAPREVRMVILETTTDIPSDTTADLESELVEFFATTPKRSSVALLSGSAPSWVAVIADILSWQTVLKASVGVFCAELAKLAAVDVWKNKAKIAIAVKSVGAQALRKFASALTKTKARLPESSVRIGLSCNPYANAQLAIRGTEEEVVATLAIFVSKVPEIDEVVKDLAKRTSAPIHLGVAEDNAIVVSWLKPGDENWSRIRISPPEVGPRGG